MIGPTGAVRVMVATKPVDFRKGAEGLAALVREEMQADPFSGAVYVFRAKRADRVKLIFWDGTGVCLFAKRLEDGEFRWPNDPGWRDAADGRAALGAAGRARLAAGSRGARDTGAGCSRADLRPSESGAIGKLARRRRAWSTCAMSNPAIASSRRSRHAEGDAARRACTRTSGCVRSSRRCSAIASAGAPRRCRKINCCSALEEVEQVEPRGEAESEAGRTGRARRPRRQAPREPRIAAGASAAHRDGGRYRGPGLPVLQRARCIGSART